MTSPGLTPAAAQLPLRVKLFNGMGSVAYGIKDNGFSTFLLIFYSQVIGLDAKLVSLALMLALIVDAFIDPVIGHLSDKTYSRWGRRHPWLYLAPVPLGLAWMLLWNPPSDHTYIFVYLVAVAILVRTLVSCCEVPSQSLVAELTSDYDERTSLIRLRYLFGWIGGLAMYALANAVFLRSDANHPVGQLNPEGYWWFGMCGAIVMAAAVLISAAGQHSRVARLPAVKPDAVSARHALGEILEALRHPAAVVLLGAALFAISSSQMSLAIANYLYLFVWQLSPTGFALLAWLLLATVVLSFVLVRPLHLKLGKRDTAIYCNLASMTIGASPFVLRYLGFWPEPGSNASTALVFAFLLFANTAGIMVFVSAQSMMADVVEASYVETGRRSEGTFAAGWMFVQKCGTAVGIGLTGLIVSLAGLPAKAKPGQVDAGVIDRLTLAYVGIVFVAGVCSTLILRRFPITRADHEARLTALDAAAMIDRDAEGAHP